MSAVTSISVLVFFWKFFLLVAVVVIANSLFNISNRFDDYVEWATAPSNSRDENNGESGEGTSN